MERPASVQMSVGYILSYLRIYYDNVIMCIILNILIFPLTLFCYLNFTNNNLISLNIKWIYFTFMKIEIVLEIIKKKIIECSKLNFF